MNHLFNKIVRMRVYLYGCASLINLFCWITLFWLFYINNRIETFFLYLTLLNFTLATIYLTLKFILELRIHKSKENESALLEIRNSNHFKFIHYKLSKFAFSMCTTVCICYWLLCLGGEALMTFPRNTFFKAFTGLYLHFFIGIIVFFEVLNSDFDFTDDKFLNDFLIFLTINIVYGTILVCLAKTYEKCKIYPFLSLEINTIVLLNIVLLIIFFNCYQMFYFLHKRKENNKLVKLFSNKTITENMI